MEGNDIEDLGGGSFRTVATVSRYSLLDQYAMGLVGPSQVPPFFYVEAPTNIVPERDREDSPDTGVTFNGTKRELRIDDVIATMGRREPSSGSAPEPIVRPSSTSCPAAARSTRRRWTSSIAFGASGRLRFGPPPATA